MVDGGWVAGRGKCSSFARHSRRTCRGWDGRPAIRSTGCPFFDGLIATYYKLLYI